MKDEQRFYTSEFLARLERERHREQELLLQGLTLAEAMAQVARERV